MILRILRVNVVLVQLNVAVTDDKGNYVTGLKPGGLRHHRRQDPPEDLHLRGEQRIRPQCHGDGPARPGARFRRRRRSGDRRSSAAATAEAAGVTISHLTDANVFILFDTSNYMYRGFVFAQDAIADFIRSMEDSSKVAFYSYSRNLSRATP